MCLRFKSIVINSLKRLLVPSLVPLLPTRVPVLTTVEREGLIPQILRIMSPSIRYTFAMQTPRVHRTPSRLSYLLLALLLTLPFSAAGDPVSNASSTSNAEQGNEEQGDASESEDLFKPHTFGWIEHVILSPELRWKLDAKLDTGADTSSLDAHNIRRVRYKGQSYVRFSIKNPESDKMVSLRRPYIRTVRIRKHSGNHQRRRVVLMTVCLGSAERTIEVTLTDREFFDYPMLLGRSALSGLAVVNPMATYTTEPDCKTRFDQDAESDDEMALANEKPGSDIATASAQNKELSADKTPIDKKEDTALDKKRAGDEKPKGISTRATSGEESASLSTQNAFCAASERQSVTCPQVSQSSDGCYVCS